MIDCQGDPKPPEFCQCVATLLAVLYKRDTTIFLHEVCMQDVPSDFISDFSEIAADGLNPKVKFRLGCHITQDLRTAEPEHVKELCLITHLHGCSCEYEGYLIQGQ